MNNLCSYPDQDECYGVYSQFRGNIPYKYSNLTIVSSGKLKD